MTRKELHFDSAEDAATWLHGRLRVAEIRIWILACMCVLNFAGVALLAALLKAEG
jgi:hypothetical protein